MGAPQGFVSVGGAREANYGGRVPIARREAECAAHHQLPGGSPGGGSRVRRRRSQRRRRNRAPGHDGSGVTHAKRAGPASRQVRRPIHKVDEGIANSKTQLVMQSRRLGQATKFALALHNKLQQDHQILLSETARSRAMKAVRSQLALKEKRVMMERRQLQMDSMQLASLEQKARTLLSPQFRPSAAELQVSARNIHVKIPESPPMFMLQGKGDLASNVAKKVSGAGVDPTLAHTIQNSINEGLKQH